MLLQQKVATFVAFGPFDGPFINGNYVFGIGP
jgi:hypothetical protein